MKKKIQGTYCNICGRLLTRPESIENGVGPICIQKLGIRYGHYFEEMGVTEWLEKVKLCARCTNFTASKRGDKSKDKYKLYVMSRDKSKPFLPKINYEAAESIVGFCEVYRVFVDGNVCTNCEYHKER